MRVSDPPLGGRPSATPPWRFDFFCSAVIGICHRMFSFCWWLPRESGLVFTTHIGPDTGHGCASHPETAMTDFLNNPASGTTTSASKFTLLTNTRTSRGSARPGPSGAVDTDQLTAWVAAEQDRDDAPTDEQLTPADIAALSTRRLRILLNQAYALMDADHPPYGAHDRYQMLIDELERRVEAAVGRAPASACGSWPPCSSVIRASSCCRSY